MASKGALKAIKASIDSNDFTTAVENAAALVRTDPKNYTGLLFLGFARDKLNQYDAAEQAYHLAAKLKPADPQVLKGLITLFEKQGSAKIAQYHDAVVLLAQLYAENDDRDQCQSVVDKYELFAKKHGSKQQYRHALELLLPTSPLYNTLEGRVPQPSHTYLRILESAEAEEKDWINTQIGERRTRLGAKIDQVTQQVRCEAINKFRMEEIYVELINWTTDDDERHRLEEELLQRAYDNLLPLPAESKASQRDKVLNIANGMVIIRHPFAFAWKIAMDWVDADSLTEWDTPVFYAFMEQFPEEGLTKVLRAHLASDDSSGSQTPALPAEEAVTADLTVRLSESDRLILMTEGIEDCPESLLAHRIMSETYLRLEEYESAADVARKAQKLHLQAVSRFGLELQNSLDAVNVCLGDALIYYQSPRHHAEATVLFHQILQRKPLLTAPLVGIGLILEEDEDYADAVKFLARAAERDPDNIRIRVELAWCRARNGALVNGLEELQIILKNVVESEESTLPLQAEVLYRIAFCKWHLDPTSSARRDRNGPYRDLIAAVKANSSFAPAYTLLGIYFQDYTKSKQRARVALQKAFELSTSELQAAERLAKIFADTSEWDLVELVAQRVVSSGKARPAPGSKKQALSWPYAALGVVQMNKQQYSQSVVSFQAALRISPLDYHAWVGLGESYHNSGRYVAAARTFVKAESLDHGLTVEQTWFAKYMLANVQREMGAFDDAIKGYQEVLSIAKNELGVMVALLQTMAENSRAKLELGMYGESIALGLKTLQIAQDTARLRTDVFNLWKATADAFSVLSACIAAARTSDITTMTDSLSLLEVNLEEAEFSLLQDSDRVTLGDLVGVVDESPLSAGKTALLAAILASKRGIYACASDIHAQASAWFNLGWAEYQAFFSLGSLLQTDGKKLQRFLKAAMRCFKKAIELESGNAEYWNALGVVTMVLNPKVSQHSFVRSLHLNEHSSRTWTNIGALYLLNDGYELANEAFTRAQSSDPEYSPAWIGQGLLATLYGNLKEARGLFIHAFEISAADSVPAKRQYGMAAFDHLSRHPLKSNITIDLLQPLFALRQLAHQAPSDPPFIHLLALFAERVESFEEAAEKSFASTLKAVQGPTSDEQLPRKLQANADMARSYLASGRYEDALEHSEKALESSGFGAQHSEPTRKWRLSAHLTKGLAHFHLKMYQDAITALDLAREESNDNPDTICMLAQLHWARGGDDGPETATDLLFSSIERHPDHVPSVILLAVIGLLNGDDDILEAVEDDLKALRVNDKVGVQDQMRVAHVLGSLLACQHASSDAVGNEEEEGLNMIAVADATKSVMLAPTQPQGWSELAEAVVMDEEAYPAEMALVNATRQVPPGGALTADEYAGVLAKTGRRRDALRSAVVAPWREDGWAGLVGSVVAVKK